MPETLKVPVKEKIGYAMGDVATNFFFQSMILYQTRFYTDTAGISAVAVGSMFLFLRWADAIFDPLIGPLRPHADSLGKVPPLDPLDCGPLWPHLLARLRDTELRPGYKTRIRLHHLRALNDDVLRQ